MTHLRTFETLPVSFLFWGRSSHLKRLSTLETTFVSANGLQAHNHPAWLGLYLSACKLLDLALALPASRLPQFQM
jgi:hypothetical protein